MLKVISADVAFSAPSEPSTADPSLRASPGSGKRQAVDMFLPAVYEELLRLARARLARSCGTEITSAGELVHEVYLRLVERRCTDFESRRHFFFAAARAMRDILVEKARKQASSKRGGRTVMVALEGLEIAAAPQGRALDLVRALEGLRRVSPECAQVVRLSYFDGLTHPEIGEALGLSRATVERRWAHARAWLRRRLSPREEAIA